VVIREVDRRLDEGFEKLGLAACLGEEIDVVVGLSEYRVVLAQHLVKLVKVAVGGRVVEVAIQDGEVGADRNQNHID
jgi:hypothetical protein